MKLWITMPQGEVRDSFIPPAAMDALKALGEVACNQSTTQLTQEELRDGLVGVDVCVTGWGATRFTPEALEKADALRIIAHTGGTVGTFVTPEVYDRGITVLSGNEYFARSVAEGVVGYMLASLRRIPKYSQQMSKMGWYTPGWWTQGLLGQRVGLVGFGAVARHLTGMLRAFDCEVWVHADHVTPEEEAQYGIRKVGLEELMQGCAIVSLHLAKTPLTHHIIDARMLALLQDGALFVNTARGSVVDESALAKELSTGRFRAVLDVYQTEPLPMDSPLRGHDNALLMPHMAGPTVDRRPLITLGIAAAIKETLAGGKSALSIPREQAVRMTQ